MRILKVAAALSLTLLFAGCSKRSTPQNVLLISIDTLRADAIGCYNPGANRHTPAMDELASESLVFANAVTPVPTTLPAHSSLLTGRCPGGHGVLLNAQVLPEKIPTLAEALRSKGFRTGAFVGSYIMDQRFGLGRGFDVYDDEMSGRTERSADAIVARALDFLDEDADRPFFLFVHLYEPHRPYKAVARFQKLYPASPEANRREQALSSYLAEVSAVDEQIGFLLEGLESRELEDHTMVVLLSDHGEALFEHDGYTGHGVQLYEESIRIPLIMRVPGVPHREIQSLAGITDVTPTILDLLRLEPLEGADGFSLVPRFFGKDPASSREGYRQRVFCRASKARRFTGQFDSAQTDLAIRTQSMKLILNPLDQTRELFDISSDPYEREDLFLGKVTEVQAGERLEAELSEGMGCLIPARPAVSLRDDPEAQERLRALGYLN